MRRFGLFVGIDSYRDIAPLRCAVNDATELAGLFRHRLRFDHCKHLRDPGASEVLRELAAIGNLAKPGDLLVFFFAGHGKQHQDNQFLMFPDVDGEAVESGELAGNPDTLALSLIKRRTQWPGVGRALILDMCRSPLRGQQRDAEPARFEGEAGLRDIVLRRASPGPADGSGAPAPFAILNSCCDQQQARELPQYGVQGHGLFSAALIEELSQGRRNIDTGLVNAIGQRMDALCAQHQLQPGQRPFRAGDDLPLDDEPQAKEAASAASPKAPEPPPAPAPAPTAAPAPTPPADPLPALQADFARQLQAGALTRPAGDCCRDTLDRLTAVGAPPSLRRALAEELQAALDVQLAQVTSARAQERDPKPAEATPPRAAPRQPTPAPSEAPAVPTTARSRWGLKLAGAALIAIAALAVVLPRGKKEEPAPAPALAAMGSVASTSPVCVECPQMVAIPAGQFVMGSPDSEAGRDNDEGPTRTVAVSAFELAKTEVTVGEYAAFIKANPGYDAGNSCWSIDNNSKWQEQQGRNWANPPFGDFKQTNQHPVVCVNWNDAQAYVKWLNARPGSPGNYRLASEAEWEYAARAGSKTAKHWGESSQDQCRYANGGDKALKTAKADWPYSIQDCDDKHPYTAPVGSYEANAWGLKDMLGNAWEWTQDCWHDSYKGAPGNAQAWEAGGDCGNRVLRGGAWVNSPRGLRAAVRNRDGAGVRDDGSGFRLARTVSS